MICKASPAPVYFNSGDTPIGIMLAMAHDATAFLFGNQDVKGFRRPFAYVKVKPRRGPVRFGSTNKEKLTVLVASGVLHRPTATQTGMD